MSKAAGQFWMGLVAQLGCVVCTRLGRGHVPAQVHHIAEGSKETNDNAVAPLCVEHHDPHRTGTGFHGMGEERFCLIFKVPSLSEYGLLIWTNEDLARALRSRRILIGGFA